MVMEHMLNGSLYHLLHNLQPLEWPIRYRIAEDITSGLALLHSKNILHRDLKSLNVLLYSQGIQIRAKLTDFGLSKVKNETTSMTSKASSQSVGTLPWMAPELFQLRARYTQKSDMYSYGMVLWELASRKVPFAEVGHAAIIMRHIEKGEREDIPEDCPPSFAKLIKWCWHQEPEKRPTIDVAAKALAERNQEQGETNSTSTAPSYRGNLTSECPDYRLFSENDPSTPLGNGMP
jgi:serine/threonine protein kinase